jgi:hypothetical protein
MTKTSIGIQELRERIGEKAKAEGRGWSTWSAAEVYGSWGLYTGYGVLWRSARHGQVS